MPAHMPNRYKDLTALDTWEPFYDTDGEPRNGAELAELTGVLDLDDWSKGI